MKIEIDTTKDGKDEIQKAVKLLLSLLGDSPVLTNSPNIFESASASLTPISGTQTPTANAFSLFDTPVTQAVVPKPVKKTTVEYY